MKEVSQKEEIIDALDLMKETSPSTLYRIGLDCIGLCLRSAINLGITSKQTKGTIRVFRDMFRISKEEKSLIKLIRSNIDRIDLDEASDVIDSLNELSESTYLSYDCVLSDIENAIQLKDRERTITRPDRINSLITNTSYKTRVLKLIKKNE